MGPRGCLVAVCLVLVVTACDALPFVGDEPLDAGLYTFVLFSPDPIHDPMLLGERVEKN